MRILQAVGFFLFLLTLLVLMPRVFAELTETILVFLNSSQQALKAAGAIAAYAGTLPHP